MASSRAEQRPSALLAVLNNTSNELEQVRVCLTDCELCIQRRDAGSRRAGQVVQTSPRTAFATHPVSEEVGADSVPDSSQAVVEQAPLRTVVLHPEGPSGPGLSIMGGRDYDLPIRISKIFPGRVADRHGDVHVNDLIVSINGVNVEAVTHRRAVELLKSDPVQLELRKCPPTSQGSVSSITNMSVHGGSFRTSRRGMQQGSRPLRSSTIDPASAQSAASTSASSSQWIHYMTIPLQQACVSVRMTGTSKLRPNSFQVSSSVGQLGEVLYCTSDAEVVHWCALVRSRVTALNRQLLGEMNTNLPATEKVVHFGWVAVRQAASEQWKNYVPKFMVLRCDRVQLFDSPPSSSAALGQTTLSYPILTSHCCEVPADKLLDDWAYSLCITAADGGELYIAAECRLELLQWLQHLRQVTVNAALDGLMSFSGVYSRRPVQLTVDLQEQLSLVDGQDQSVVFRKPFAQLVKTAYDGNSVSLVFTQAPTADAEADQSHLTKDTYAIQFRSGQHGVTHTIHNMMLAAVATLDPSILKAPGPT